MKTGFGHFDRSHQENFCASLLLLTMECDDSVQQLIASVVREALRIDRSSALLSFGREARLEETDDDNYARVDLWLLFGSPSGPFYAFVEVKTRNTWDETHVAEQVRDQAARRLARSSRPIHGSVLLAPERLCERVRRIDASLPSITWPRLLAELRALHSPSPLTDHAIRHLEDKMERAPGLERPMTLSSFEQATTTTACLREFLVDCIIEIKGHVHGDPVWLTPGDGQPRRAGGWAWHGLSVPFTLEGKKGRVGLYKYAEAPAGEEAALETLWLEAYLGEADTPIVALKFAPTTLATKELDAARAALAKAWGERAPTTTAEVTTA